LNKNLLAVAVAGALAVPGVALAQSSVTISGFLSLRLENIRVSGAVTPRTGHTSQWGVIDQGSYIQFRAQEDLGGGLTAIGQYQIRGTLDGNTSLVGNGAWSGAGQNYIALRSRSWGEVKVGTDWAHNTLSADSFSGAPSFGFSAHQNSLITGGVAVSSVFGATRVRNQISWMSPNWNGFTVHTGWSSRSASGAEGDLTTPVAGTTQVRKGNAYWVTGRYSASNWFVGLSYMNDKQDPFSTATSSTASDRKGWRAAGRVSFNNFRIGLTYDKTKRTNVVGAAGGVTSTPVNNRTVYVIPVDYTMGPHMFGVLYSVARDDKLIANSGSKQWSLRYAYSLSKRTKIGFGYTKLTNEAGAAYTLGDNSSNASGNSAINQAQTAGEDVRKIGMSIQHAF
jgi:predicted porin